MLEKLEKEIELDKEIIASFPTNNKKNQEKYLSEMQKRIDSYKQLENDVYIELCERIKPYLNLETSKLNDINDGILELSKALAFTNNLNTAYEKLGLDKIVCKISNYSKENLNEINKIILDAIKAFEYAGIILKSKDFNYTKFVNKYMTAFFDNIDNLDSEKLKNIFNDIYWKNPDTILEIELNIRYLYLINESKIEKNILKIQKEILNSFNKGEEKMIENYSYLRNQLEAEKEKDKNALINKFTSGELKIDSYTDDKISKITNELFPININYEIVKDLLNSLREYKNHLSYEEIITKVKTLFNEALEKNFLDNKLKTIIKLEKKREKLNSKKMGAIKKTHVDKNELEINKLVK